MCVCNDDISHRAFSVVQADKEFPECQDLRDAILDEFRKTVFTQKPFKEVNSANRGPCARGNLELIQGAMGHSCKATRTVGVRETFLYENIEGFENQGFLRPLGTDENSDWVSRVFLVPEPNGKW